MLGNAKDEEGGNCTRGSMVLLSDTVTFLLGPGSPTPPPPKHTEGVGVGIKGEPQDLIVPSLLPPYGSACVPVMGRAAVKEAGKYALGVLGTTCLEKILEPEQVPEPATLSLLEAVGTLGPEMLPAVRLQLRKELVPISLRVSSCSLSGELDKVRLGGIGKELVPFSLRVSSCSLTGELVLTIFLSGTLGARGVPAARPPWVAGAETPANP